MVDPVSATISACTLTLQAVIFVKKLYDSNSAIPGTLDELSAISQTIFDTITPIRDTNESLNACLSMIDRELMTANRILESLKHKSKKFFFNPNGTLAKVHECTTKLKEAFDLLVSAQKLAEGQHINSNLIITDPTAKRFWATCIGENTLVVKYDTFCAALKTFMSLTPAQFSRLGGRPASATMNVHLFHDLTQKKRLEGLIELLAYCNPFVDPVAPSAKMPVVVNPEGLPALHESVKSLNRQVNWTGASADKANSVNKYFFIMCDAGGVLDVFEQSNRPGYPVMMLPFTGAASQKWKFDKYGCICNLNSGLVLDVDSNSGSLPRVIQWPRHGGPNQKWKLGLDRSLRVEIMPDKCMDIDRGSSCATVYTWRGNRQNQMFRLVSEVMPPTPAHSSRGATAATATTTPTTPSRS